eukprot:366344-Chlamydomonas_euryale.AAC.2
MPSSNACGAGERPADWHMMCACSTTFCDCLVYWMQNNVYKLRGSRLHACNALTDSIACRGAPGTGGWKPQGTQACQSSLAQPRPEGRLVNCRADKQALLSV